MKHLLYIFTVLISLTHTANATTRDAALTNTTAYNYNYMYPYLNNKMRTNLNPGVTPSQSSNPINTVVRTISAPNERRVVPRQLTRTATTTQTQPSASQNTRRVASRASVPQGTATQSIQKNSQRRVIARSAGPQNTNMRTAARTQNTRGTDRDTNNTYYTADTAQRVSSVRCLADYTDCMNNYCERKDTAYNKCYCSSKLSQIDEKYQNSINNLINQLLTIKGTNNWSDSEMHQYWMDTVGKYSGENSWINLDQSLDIDWASMESRVRGQNAFAMGHDYCVQHLKGCNYMSTNLRDAYRSEISRDCDTYEESLQKIKNIAESIIEEYK